MICSKMSNNTPQALSPVVNSPRVSLTPVHITTATVKSRHVPMSENQSMKLIREAYLETKKHRDSQLRYSSSTQLSFHKLYNHKLIPQARRVSFREPLETVHYFVRNRSPQKANSTRTLRRPDTPQKKVKLSK